MAAQSVSRDNTLVCKSRFQPYTAYGALAYFVIIIIFNGWKVFTHGNWSIEVRFASTYSASAYADVSYRTSSPPTWSFRSTSPSTCSGRS